MFKRIFKSFINLPAEELATYQLEEAKVNLLEAYSNLEHAKMAVEILEERVKRLTNYTEAQNAKSPE